MSLLPAPVADINEPEGEGEGYLRQLAKVRWKEAKKLREQIEGLYDEAVRYSIPGRAGFTLTADGHEIYDDTAPQAVPEFASTIQGSVTPPFSAWASHITGRNLEEHPEREQVAANLQAVDDYVFGLINSSNATQVLHESYIDLAVGTACFRIDAGSSLHPLAFRGVPHRNLWFTIGPDGKPDAIFEGRKLTRREIAVEFPNAKIPPRALDRNVSALQDSERLLVVDGWLRDWGRPAANIWHNCLFFPENEFFIGQTAERKGRGAHPFVGPVRWSTASLEGWGRGPLVNLLPSLRTINFAMAALIDHADLALAGVWTYENDGEINPDTFTLEPGTVIPHMPGTKGLQNLRPAQDFNIQQFMIEEMRKNIREALLVDALGDPNKSPMKAAEVHARMSQLAKRVGSPYARIVTELVYPMMARVTRILKDRGLIELPAIDGENIDLVPTSPLAQAQTYDQIERLQAAIGFGMGTFGPEMTMSEYDPSRAIREVHHLYRVNPKLLRSEEEKANVLANAASIAGVGEEQDGIAEAAPEGGGQLQLPAE